MSSATTPLVLVGSGYRITEGSSRDFLGTYSAMVDEMLARPPEVEIVAYHEPAGISGYRVFGSITNVTQDQTFGWDNEATLNVIVYEDEEVIHTDHFVRQGAFMDFEGDVGPGETWEFSIDVPDVIGAAPDKSHVLVVVDHRPGGESGKFASLQVVEATDSSAVTPTEVPTALPTSLPTEEPTAEPTAEATAEATEEPTPTAVPGNWMAYLPSVSNAEEN